MGVADGGVDGALRRGRRRREGAGGREDARPERRGGGGRGLRGPRARLQGVVVARAAVGGPAGQRQLGVRDAALGVLQTGGLESIYNIDNILTSH